MKEWILCSNDYTYDALYRLVEATGREYIGMKNHPHLTGFDHPHDGKAMCRYVEKYSYNELGNFLIMKHNCEDQAGLVITNTMNEVKLRLENTAIASASRVSELAWNSAFTKGMLGLQGNISSMPNLLIMEWEYKDQFPKSGRQIFWDGIPETTWYVYDGTGQRIRKITERL